MSGSGHERRFRDVRVMSATASTAAQKRTFRIGSDGPQAVIAAQKLSPPIRQKKTGVPLWSPSSQLVGTRLDAKDSSKGGRPSKEAIRKEAHQDDFQRLIRVQ